MAGNYPDAPGLRMPYDRDGSELIQARLWTSVITQHPQSFRQALNSESLGTVVFGDSDDDAQTSRIGLIFPELRDVVGYWLAANSNPSGNVRTSADTTNMLDGTWTTVAAISASSPSKAAMRDQIRSVSASGVKALAFEFAHGGGGNHNDRWQGLHVYGTLAAGESPDRLRIWHPTLDEEVGPAYFDWADIRQSTSADKTFRVKNLSPTLTAQAPLLEVEAPTDTTPSVPAQHLLSLNGVDFAASVTPPDLGPGATSDVITIRRNLGAGAALGLWWARVIASATSWEVA